MLELRTYLASDGGSPFEEWFTGLDAPAAAKVAVALARLEQGNCRTPRGRGGRARIGDGKHQRGSYGCHSLSADSGNHAIWPSFASLLLNLKRFVKGKE